jgi:hypothetical protein
LFPPLRIEHRRRFGQLVKSSASSRVARYDESSEGLAGAGLIDGDIARRCEYATACPPFAIVESPHEGAAVGSHDEVDAAGTRTFDPYAGQVAVMHDAIDLTAISGVFAGHFAIVLFQRDASAASAPLRVPRPGPGELRRLDPSNP